MTTENKALERAHKKRIRLLDAAQVLLEALEGMVAQFGANSDYDDDDKIVVDAARAAIAQAS